MKEKERRKEKDIRPKIGSLVSCNRREYACTTHRISHNRLQARTILPFHHFLDCPASDDILPIILQFSARRLVHPRIELFINRRQLGSNL